MPMPNVLRTLLAALALTAPQAAAQTETAEAGADDAQMKYVYMATSLGDILLELDAEKAPVTVENFLTYVDDDAYDGTIFHRVISDFMIQGGGFEPDGTKRPTRDPIKNEADNGLSNERGTIAMARTPRPDSATNQFFINVIDNGFRLDPRPGNAGYAVFGRVIEGMDTVDRIRNVPTENRGGAFVNAPKEPVVIESVERIDKSELDDARQRIKETAAKAAVQPGIDLLKERGVDVEQGELDEETGIWSVVVQEGEGGRTPELSDRVKVHYTGWFVDGEKFDSSHDRGEPATFPLGGVIKGWQEGVGEMTVGEKRYLVIPHEMAYGPAGRPPAIPPKATLVFEVELLDILGQ